MRGTTLQLERDGAELLPGLALGMLAELNGILADCPADRAGVRLVDNQALANLLSPAHVLGQAAASHLGPQARAVRAVLFDKSPQANWQLDWHQDRTIAVRQQRDVAGYINWNRKQGIVHCEPPFAIMQQMLTLRVHLDPVAADNGVLEVVGGSHRLGRIAEPGLPDVVRGGPIHSCPAQAGDCWVYRTPILHRSARSRSAARRRVLQVDYCAADLPGGLEWRGV